MSNKVNYDILKEIEQCEDTRPDFMTQDDIGRSVLLHGHTCLVCRLSSRCCVRVLCIPCLCVCECFCHSTARVPYTCVLSFRQPADIVAEVNRLCAPKVEFMDSPSLVSFFSYNIFFNFFLMAMAENNF